MTVDYSQEMTEQEYANNPVDDLYAFFEEVTQSVEDLVDSLIE